MPDPRKSSIKYLAKSQIIDPLRRIVTSLRHAGQVPLAWCPGPNWGDALNPVLIELLAGRKAAHVDGLHHRRYLAIGSILGTANEHSEVWGSGFIEENAAILGVPRAVHAVRGPLSRARLLELGIDCPEVYGDPALLLPRFFRPTVEKTHAVGIIPHYVDKEHPWLARQALDPSRGIFISYRSTSTLSLTLTVRGKV